MSVAQSARTRWTLRYRDRQGREREGERAAHEHRGFSWKYHELNLNINTLYEKSGGRALGISGAVLFCVDSEELTTIYKRKQNVYHAAGRVSGLGLRPS